MKKRVLVAFIIFALLLIIFFFIPIRFNISDSLTAKYIADMANGSSTETEIFINGTYSFYLFRSDKFEGNLEIVSFPETSDKRVEIRVADGITDTLVYRSWDGSKLNSQVFGLLQADFKMKNLIILLNDTNGAIDLSGKNVSAILVGNKTVEDLKNVLESMK